jgi:hypothetical protein
VNILDGHSSTVTGGNAQQIDLQQIGGAFSGCLGYGPALAIDLNSILSLPTTTRNHRLVRRGDSGRRNESAVLHSSDSIPLRVSLFLVEILSAAARTIFPYRNLARTRTAGRASSGGSTTHVITYFRKTSISATCA